MASAAHHRSSTAFSLTNRGPIAVEVFSGQLHDDATLGAQISKLKDRFHLKSVVVVCDRGMVTKANMQTLKDHRSSRLALRNHAHPPRKLIQMLCSPRIMPP
jgi:hypothetical protein